MLGWFLGRSTLGAEAVAYKTLIAVVFRKEDSENWPLSPHVRGRINRTGNFLLAAFEDRMMFPE